MALTESQLREALDRLTDPTTGTGIVSSGAVRALTVEGGTVRLVLDVPAAQVPAMQEVRSKAEVLIRALGVSTVSVVLTAATEPAPEFAAPERVEGVRHIIAVGSGKGGVGKSTVSVNLAVALAERGLKVGLMDADIYGPSVPTMLGITGRPIGRENKLLPLGAHGVKAMSVGMLMEPGSALVWRGPILVTAIRQLLHDVTWAPLDVLVVDLPPGTGDVQITLTQTVPIDGALIVSTPQDVALIDARRAIDLFHQTGTPVLGLVENMAMHVCSNCGHLDPVFGSGGAEAEAAEQDIPFLGRLPLSRPVREGGDSGVPIIKAAPESAEAAAFRDLAAEIAAFLED